MPASIYDRLLELPPAKRRELISQLRRHHDEQVRGPVPTPRLGPYPASPGQASQWYLWNLAPDGDAYHVTWIYELCGSLDVPAIEAALTGLIARHEILRTTYRQDSDQVFQVIGPATPVTLIPTTVDGIDEDGRRAAALELAAAAGREPFDLRTGPLHRARLWAYGSQRHLLLMAFHHSVLDEWSRHIIERDLSALYARSRGVDSPLPSPRQYVDVMRAAGETAADDLRYWRCRLAGVRPTAIPADRHGGSLSRRPAGRHVVTLDDTTAVAYDRIARDCGTTRFVVQSALCWLFLARQSGATDVCLGTPVSGRDGAAAEDAVGFFLNTVVLRGHVDAIGGFRALVRHAHETFVEAMLHRNCPFDEVVRSVRTGREIGSDPLVGTLFTYVRGDTGDDGCELRLAGMRVATLPVRTSDAQLDLTLTVFDLGEKLNLCVDYAADRYTPATARSWGDALRYLADATAADDRAPLAPLLLASPAERQWLAAWRRADTDSTRRMSVPELLAKQVGCTPHEPAIITGARLMTYAEADRAASVLAAGLHACGVRRGDHVTLRLPTGPVAVVVVWAVWRAGAAVVARGTAGRSPAAGQGAWLVEVGVREWLARRGEGTLAIHPDLATWPLDDVPAEITTMHSDELACVIGERGVLVGHSGLAEHAAVLTLRYAESKARLGRPPRVAVTAAPTSPRFLSQLLPVAAGYPLVVVDQLAGRFAPGSIGECARDPGFDAIDCTMSQVASLVAARLFDGAPTPSLVSFSGGPCSRRVWDRLSSLAGTRAHHTLEIPECAGEVAGVDVATGALGTFGRPRAGAEVSVRDASLRPTPVGVVGDIVAGGRGITWGYLGRPGSTAVAFVPDPWAEVPGARVFRCGRRGRVSADGLLTECPPWTDGDRTEMVEAALAEVAGVWQVAVVAVLDHAAVPRLTAYLVCEENFRISQTALCAALAHRMRVAVPVRFLRVPRLPFTADGEIDRERLMRVHA